MNPCFVCKQSHTSNKQLCEHIKKSHTVAAYQCGENACLRCYSNSKSFLKHRNRDHPDEIGCVNIAQNEAPTVDIVSPEISSQEEISTNYNNNDDDVNNSDNDGDYDNNDDTPSFWSTAYEIATSSSLNKVTILLAYFYSLPDIVRKKVPDFIQMFSSVFLGSSFIHLETTVCNRLSALGESEENLNNIKNLFKTSFSPFQGLETEHLIFKHFEDVGSYFPPQSLTIGFRDEYKGPNKTIQKVPCTMEFIPMRSVLKRFFEIPNVLQQVMSYYQMLSNETSVISNIIQAECWKSMNIPFDLKQPVFPLSIYFDDLETNNPLGSHAGIAKIGAVYLNLPCLPPNFISKVENIFLFALFHSLDRSTFGNKMVFAKIIDELQYLEKEGVTVELKNFKTKILFKFMLILGDNLGLHSLLGFNESFSGNYPCRFCLTEKSQFGNVFRESQCILRNEENYETDLKNKDHGVKEGCVFTSILSFHPTTNFAVDYMHDFYEGVVRYDIGSILHKYVQVQKIFTLDLLNDRRNGFMYDVNDKRNKPPEITPHHISQKTFNMSASETKCFLKILPFLIGDKVNDDCDLWELIIKLKNLSLLLTAKDIHKNSYELVDNEIANYLQALKRSFPEISFKPKHHHMIHYGRIMKMIGPLCVAAGFRNESKHQMAKQTAKVSRSRVNITKTAAIKNQLSLNYRFLTDLGEYPPFTNGSYSSPALIQNLGIDLLYISALSSLIGPFRDDLRVSETKSITAFGYTITPSSILAIPEEDGCKFIEVNRILLEQNLKVIIFGNKLNTTYNFKYSTYKLNDNEVGSPTCVLFEELIGCTVCYKARLAPLGDYYIVI